MRRSVLLFTAVAALLVAPPAQAGPAEDVRAARRGLARAIAAGRLPAEEAHAYGSVLSETLALLPRLPADRARSLGAVLRDVAALAPSYDAPRALALFSMLDANRRYLGTNGVPPPGKDVQVERVVYRAIAGRGLQFHPLANFARLNSELAAGRKVEAENLALELVARAVPVRGALTWEYYFGFGGGRAPWTSGMAQAVAAQALARAGHLDEARLAFRAVPDRLLVTVAGFPWIRLYAFSGLAVLNAHLQALLSLGDYAQLAGDAEAADLAARMQAGAVALLAQFDTGAWSLYSLGGREASLAYHSFVVSLLRRLAARTRDPVLTDAAARFALYLRQPPAIAVRSASSTLYPVPAEGFLDEAVIAFRLSKMSTVALAVSGAPPPVTLARGAQTLRWRPGRRPPGVYVARLVAVDLAGNRAEVSLPPMEVRRDTVPPQLTEAALVGARLRWSAVDEGSPWLELALVLRRGDRRSAVALGRRPLAGSLRLALPGGAWQATLVAVDSSGNSSTVALGAVGARLT